MSYRLLLAAVALTATGCDKEAAAPELAPRSPAAVAISPSDITLDDGGRLQLSATVLDQNGMPFSSPPPGVTVSWSVEDESVATVSASGMLTAAGAGRTVVTATAGSASGLAALRVRGSARITGTVTMLPFVMPPWYPGFSEGGVSASWYRAATWGAGPEAAIQALVRVSPLPGELISDHSLVVRLREGSLSSLGVQAADMRSRPAVAAAAAALRAELGGVLHELQSRAVPVSISTVVPALGLVRVTVDDPARLAEVRARLLRDPSVLSAEPEQLVLPYTSRPNTTASAAGPLQDPRVSPRQRWHYNVIGVPRAWDLSRGEGVIVAVIDDGIRDHPAIRPNLTSDGYNFVAPGPLPLCDGRTIDRSGLPVGPDATTPDVTYDRVPGQNCFRRRSTNIGGHGLHVAGTIAARGPGETGIAPAARIRVVRALGLANGTDLEVANAVLYAAGFPVVGANGQIVQASPGARIINMSLGSQANPSVPRAYDEAISLVTRFGTLVVVAAGNDSILASNAAPARHPDALTVASLGPDYRISRFSNFGAAIDVAAPGGDFSLGSTAAVYSLMWNFQSNQPTYHFANGTSMAAPHVSGVAALLLGREPGLTVSQLKARIIDYAVDLGPPGKDDHYGYGLVNVWNSLTRSHAASGRPFARLYSATSGALVDEVLAADGSFRFDGVGAGSYFLFAGVDDNHDGVIGWPGRPWAAAGTRAPAPVQVNAGGAVQASITLGLPFESEPNNTREQATRVVVGGYIYGRFASFSDQDWYVVTVPGGRYTIETAGWMGACGFALEADTDMALYDERGTRIGGNADIDVSSHDYCSRISMTLAAGTYYIRLTEERTDRPGRYVLAVRSGA